MCRPWEGFDAPTGRAVRGIVEGRHAAMENERPMVEVGVDPGSFAAEAERLRSDGATVFFAACHYREPMR